MRKTGMAHGCGNPLGCCHEPGTLAAGDLMRALKRGDNVHQAIQLDIARGTEVCVKLLTDSTSTCLTDDAVHEVRTRIKKMRSLLRLVRPSLGESRYQRAKRCLQQASRPLAPIRDARVVLATCEGLMRRWGGADRASLDAALERRLEKALATASPTKRRTMARNLSRILGLTTELPAKQAGWSSLSHGLQRTYARGRKAFEAAHSSGSDAGLHELRKCAKDLLYTCSFLRKASPRATALISDLRRLTDLLGNAHDLAIVKRLASPRGPVHEVSLRRRLAESAARRQAFLRSQAWKIGSRIYDKSAHAFAKHFHRDWKKWRSD